jgi:hypothetical protein
MFSCDECGLFSGLVNKKTTLPLRFLHLLIKPRLVLENSDSVDRLALAISKQRHDAVDELHGRNLTKNPTMSIFIFAANFIFFIDKSTQGKSNQHTTNQHKLNHKRANKICVFL